MSSCTRKRSNEAGNIARIRRQRKLLKRESRDAAAAGDKIRARGAKAHRRELGKLLPENKQR